MQRSEAGKRIEAEWSALISGLYFSASAELFTKKLCKNTDHSRNVNIIMLLSEPRLINIVAPS